MMDGVKIPADEGGWGWRSSGIPAMAARAGLVGSSPCSLGDALGRGGGRDLFPATPWME
jgi:hypothetical protein